jgi:hypothetical protein
MNELPIACTLPAGEVPDRLALIESLAADALLTRTALPDGLRLRFRGEAEDRVRELADLESRCCAFLDFAIGHDGGAVTLDVTGAPDARPVIEQFFAA